ncbi:MAG: transcriptional regulator [Candidatus Eremiobacteraeota bacterium]|jgi:DNA-binding transcriptional ArsR family regulator|nr:transcriptional regulator [Candidatus Eremiobacteraeota bacterium]
MPLRAPLRRAADPNVAEVAALIGDPARSAMLFSLLDGRELPASELAFRAGASPQSASTHLGKLVAGGLLVATAVGRQRLFRLASPDVAHAIEALATIARPTPVVALSQTTTMQRLREARSCYDHLAGRLGVAITDRFVERGAITLSGRAFAVTPRGERFFRTLGIDVDRARAERRTFARACIDWSERRPHLAGSLGASVLDRFVSAGWVARNAHDRALRITPEGRAEFERRFRIRL